MYIYIYMYMCNYIMYDPTLKVGNKFLIHKLKCSVLSRDMLIGEITT